MQKKITELKSYFENGDIPNQQQFWDWMDSYWHKDEGIATVDQTDANGNPVSGNSYTKQQVDDSITRAVHQILGNVDASSDTLEEIAAKIVALMQADAGLTPLAKFNDLVENILPQYAKKYPINFTSQERDAWLAFFNTSTTSAQPQLQGTIMGNLMVNQIGTFNITFYGLNFSNLLLGTGLTDWKLIDANGNYVDSSKYTIGTYQVNNNTSVTIPITLNAPLTQAGQYTVKLYRDIVYLGQAGVMCYTGLSESLIPNSQWTKVLKNQSSTVPIITSDGSITLSSEGNNLGGNFFRAVQQNTVLPLNCEISFNTVINFTWPWENARLGVAGIEYVGLNDYTPSNVIAGVYKYGANFMYNAGELSDYPFIMNGKEAQILYYNRSEYAATSCIIKRMDDNFVVSYYDKKGQLIFVRTFQIATKNASLRFCAYFGYGGNIPENADSFVVSNIKIKTFN